MDVLWHYLSSLKYPDNSLRFPWLTNAGKVILTIPYSNAEEEKLFSKVRRINMFARDAVVDMDAI